MAKRPAFQFYPDSWLSSMDITLMTIAEEGAYHRLLCHAWEQEDCGIPDDDRQLAVLSKMGSAWKKSSEVIRRKFVSRDGRLYNERLLTERQKQAEWAEKSAVGGKKSATKRQAKGNHPSTTLAICLQPNGNSSSSSSSSIENPIVPFPQSEPPAWESKVGDAIERMLALHPDPCNLRDAVIEFREYLDKSAYPEAVMVSSEKNHAAWCEHWRQLRDDWHNAGRAGKRPWVPFLSQFFTDGYAAKLPPARASPGSASKQSTGTGYAFQPGPSKIQVAIEAEEARRRASEQQHQ